MHSEARLAELIALAYDAAVAPELWPVFLEKLATALRTTTTAFHSQDLNSQAGHIHAAVNAREEWLREYEEYYAQKNIWTLRGGHLLQQGRVVTGEMVCADRDVEASEFYNDWLWRERLSIHAFGAVVIREANLLSLLTSHRPHGGRGFSRSDILFVARLLPHLKRAVQIHNRLYEAITLNRDLSRALSRLGEAVIVIDDQCGVIFVNERGQQLLDAHVGLTVSTGRLRAIRPEDNRTLINTVSKKCDDATGRDATLTFAGEDGRPRLTVVCVPLAGSAPFPRRSGRGDRRILLFVNVIPRREDVRIDEAIVGAVFRLTDAEGRVAARAASGNPPERIASELGVSTSTVRWHLKNVFMKTGVHSRSELAAMIMASIPPIDRPRASAAES